MPATGICIEVFAPVVKMTDLLMVSESHNYRHVRMTNVFQTKRRSELLMLNKLMIIKCMNTTSDVHRNLMFSSLWKGHPCIQQIMKSRSMSG